MRAIWTMPVGPDKEIAVPGKQGRKAWRSEGRFPDEPGALPRTVKASVAMIFATRMDSPKPGIRTGTSPKSMNRRLAARDR
jgi:hypothetical protein